MKQSNNESIAALRRDYKARTLDVANVSDNPFTQFSQWFEEALQTVKTEAGVEANAMTLATCTPDGKPSARIVLLKGFDERGFIFYTNYDGRKGQEITANPHVALVFYWNELERQVRIEGRAERVEAEVSDTYYASRPRKSRLGAWLLRKVSPLSIGKSLNKIWKICKTPTVKIRPFQDLRIGAVIVWCLLSLNFGKVGVVVYMIELFIPKTRKDNGRLSGLHLKNYGDVRHSKCLAY